MFDDENWNVEPLHDACMRLKSLKNTNIWACLSLKIVLDIFKLLNITKSAMEPTQKNRTCYNSITFSNEN